MTGRLYDLQEWKRVRKRVLMDEPLCRMCRQRGITRPAQHVDHIQTVKDGGDWYERSNLQPLCHECHSAKTAGDKGYAVRLGCGRDGRPIDPAHPWNR